MIKGSQLSIDVRMNNVYVSYPESQIGRAKISGTDASHTIASSMANSNSPCVIDL